MPPPITTAISGGESDPEPVRACGGGNGEGAGTNSNDKMGTWREEESVALLDAVTNSSIVAAAGGRTPTRTLIDAALTETMKSEETFTAAKAASLARKAAWSKLEMSPAGKGAIGGRQLLTIWVPIYYTYRRLATIGGLVANIHTS
jgi:hypothetical protein